MISELGYHSVEELLEEEDIFTIFSVFRMSETPEWSQSLVAYYGQLTPENFEKRNISIRILDPIRYKITVPRLLQKQTLWEDKLLGTIFGIPIPNRESCPVPTLRILSRTYHYLAELRHHSEFVQYLQEERMGFGTRMAQVLWGKFKNVNFFETHALCEALYWEETSQRLIDHLRLVPEFEFWIDSFGIGGLMNSESGETTVVSMDLLDVLTNVSKCKPFPGNTRILGMRVKWETFKLCAGGSESSARLILTNMDRGCINVTKH
jgi:hypothetical protein